MATEAYTPEEAAERIRCKPSWLKTKAEKREIPFSMIAGTYRFTDAHIAWILDHFEEQPRPAVEPGPARAPRTRKPTEPQQDGEVQPLKTRPAKRLRAVG